MTSTSLIPTTCIRKNCVIVTVRTKRDGKPKRTTVSMHVEHYKRVAEYLGGSDWLARVVKYTAAHLEARPGDNLSQMVWAQIDANKEKWREAIASGALQ